LRYIYIYIYIKARQLVVPEIGTLIHECNFASENTSDTYMQKLYITIVK